MSASGSEGLLAKKISISLGGDTIYDADLIPTLWWVALTLGSCINIGLLVARLANLPKDPYPRKMTQCAAIFVVACMVRSIWPRVDVERTCFWDSRLSWPFVGRVLATVAEICFAAQFSMIIGMLATEVEYPRTRRVADIIFWAICVAQCCCWMGVTTQRQIWHGVEESIWGFTFTAVAVCMALLFKARPHRGRCTLCKSGNAGYVERYLVLGFPLSLVYVGFMFLVDVPMYVNRYLADSARGAKYLWVSEGILDSMSCKTVSKSMADWAPEMPWMTGYFLGATAMSLWLTWGPKFHHDVKNE